MTSNSQVVRAVEDNRGALCRSRTGRCRESIMEAFLGGADHFWFPTGETVSSDAPSKPMEHEVQSMPSPIPLRSDNGQDKKLSATVLRFETALGDVRVASGPP